jgi:hypothetical protein
MSSGRLAIQASREALRSWTVSEEVDLREAWPGTKWRSMILPTNTNVNEYQTAAKIYYIGKGEGISDRIRKRVEIQVDM